MSESPAEVIRRAAALMRGKAAAANPGPWRSFVEGRDHRGGSDFILTGTAEPGGDGRGEDIYVHVSGSHNDLWNADQDYIASWHPLVAEAVADLLEEIARQYEAPPCDSPDGVCNGCERREDFNDAVRLAGIYLGEVTRYVAALVTVIGPAVVTKVHPALLEPPLGDAAPRDVLTARPSRAAGELEQQSWSPGGQP